MIRPGDRVLAAVSGGGDSVLMLHLLARHRSRSSFTLRVAHLNHGLREGEADGDEAFVRGLASRLSLPFTAGRADLARRPGESSSVEERAREARRGFLLETARAEDCNRIALGHTLDDRVETVLMWLLRGTGRGGLAGMQAVTPQGFIRPILEVRRSEVRHWLEGAGETWREDATNQDLSRRRNRIRSRLVPLIEREFPGSLEVLADEGETFSLEDSWLERAAGDLLGPEARDLPVSLLREAPEALARRAVRAAAARSGVNPARLRRRHLRAILDLAGEGMEGRGLDLGEGARAERHGDSVVFSRRERNGGDPR